MLKTENLILDKLYDRTNNKLIPEEEKGSNIEYKLRLDKKENGGKEQMVSQMLWRMNEGKNKYGKYEAHYILGVYDDGTFSDITEKQLIHSTNILRGIVKNANAIIIDEKCYVFANNKMLVHLIIKKDHVDKHLPEINVAITGPTDTGKSSTMGCLTYGQKDDGNGFSRKLVFRHTHEKTSGNTSSIKYDTIGYMNDNLINYNIGIEFDMENIYNTSDRLINIIDLPGDIKYIKTIAYSISSTVPDYMIICIPSSIKNCSCIDYIQMNTKYYEFIHNVCVVYNIIPIFVITMADLNINDTLDKDLEEEMKIKTTFNNMTKSLSCDTSNREINFMEANIVRISNITEYGYNNLISVLSCLSKNKEYSNIENKKLFIVNDSFYVPDTGNIYHGTLKYGTIDINETVSILCHGKIYEKIVKSIHRKSVDVDRLYSGESGSITLKGSDKKGIIDKTSLILDNSWISYLSHECKIMGIFNNNIKTQQYLMFIGNTITTVSVANSISETDIENGIYQLTCMGDNKFLAYTDTIMLKDENGYILFVKIVK